ncbi:hypothetical protein GGR56DRAFT_632762 [Xylariaceae sp. FL0804]|nr:hypothetical protein GGR56DRAFT_632762 [Xylariaceae sp. FL0804]
MAFVPFKVKAVYEYTSNHEDDLPFDIGQVITVTAEEEADWYEGEYVDDSGAKREGLFPRNFVEKFEPTAPPRPTRSRKKETEPAAAPPPPVPPVAPSEPSPVGEAADAPSEEIPEEIPAASPPPPADEDTRSPPAPSVPTIPVANPPETASVPAPAPVIPKDPEPVAPTTTAQPPPPKAPAQARAAPPASDKPSGNSFKDRIAAFNKAAAPPVAPFKPSGLGSGSSGFIKKPFVAPPPSRNAYVPPPRDAPSAKVYRRDEDPEIKEREAEAVENAEKAGLAPTASSNEGPVEDQPKPTSLKERIALLQKQQAEAAQRHADAVAKKEKPRRPPKKRTESGDPQEAVAGEGVEAPPPLERQDTAEIASKKSMDEPRSTRQSLSMRRKSTGPVENDGNEADMSGAGDTTEGQEDLAERDDSDERPKPPSRVPTTATHGTEPINEDEEEGEEDEEDEEEDPEMKRKQELRARMAKMSGGMGMAGMFGPPGMMSMGSGASSKKPKPPAPTARRTSEMSEGPASPRNAPVPTMMALPGMGEQKQMEEEAVEPDASEEPLGEDGTPGPPADSVSKMPGAAPPVPGGRPIPPPVPSESRPPPPPPPAGVTALSNGSESDDELSENPQRNEVETPIGEAPPTNRAPPPVPLASPGVPNSPRPAGAKRSSYMGGEASPSSPTHPSQSSKRSSRPPPPIPGAAPPLPTQSRPPPPPPPGGSLSRTTTYEEPVATPMQPGPLDNGEEGENTEYEGDYDTDIGSAVPHKDALKAHARDSSFDDTPVRSPTSEGLSSQPPPIPNASAPRAGPPPVPSQPAPTSRTSMDAPRGGPPSIPSQPVPNTRTSVDVPRGGPPPIPSQPPPPPNSRRSIDAPRAAPPPPPPAKDVSYAHDDDYDPFNYNAVQSPPIPTPRTFTRQEEPRQTPESSPYQAPPPPPDRRGPPPAPPSARAPPRQSLDVQRPSGGRRSMDAPRPSMETGFIANDVDLATHTQWWLSRNGLPPVFQGRKDIYFESDESASPSPDGRTEITKENFILFPDYSQTVITVHFDPHDASKTELDQRHEAPPRALRQDQLEEAYEQYGRQIATTVAGKKDSVVADGTPFALLSELLRPLKGALRPVGTRAYGALVYANLANASTQMYDEIRAGDIISIRNAKFQGKHGPMHAKYSMEVGKPDHVGIVAEWDGTKKKVRAWEQGRESKKVKQESFKLDDLRSGEVKIWRVMPRSWVGWTSQD